MCALLYSNLQNVISLNFFNKGLTILVENISRMRYMAHFRAVHRGAIFESMRTTEPRRLLPDAWGFICPVHTPDGTPCGLLNHLTKSCIVSYNTKLKFLLIIFTTCLFRSLNQSIEKYCVTFRRY